MWWYGVVNWQEVCQEDGDNDLSQDVGDIVDFEIYSADTQRSHRGRIERIPVHELPWPACESSDGLVVGSHRLWVNDSHIPEFTGNMPSTADYASFEYYPVFYKYNNNAYSLYFIRKAQLSLWKSAAAISNRCLRSVDWIYL